jgi:hypothetical protein
VDDGEIEKGFERIEVAIAVQRRMMFTQAERRNQAIDRLAYGVSAAAQRAIVPRRISSKVDAARVEHLQLEQLSLDAPGDALVTYALQDFTQDQISDGETLPVERSVEPVGFRIRHAAEVVDPDGGVDDDRRDSPRDTILP